MGIVAGNGLRQMAFAPQGFRTLRSLSAGRNQLTDSCLPGLAVLPHLHRLHLPHNLIQWAMRSSHRKLSFTMLQAELPGLPQATSALQHALEHANGSNLNVRRRRLAGRTSGKLVKVNEDMRRPAWLCSDVKDACISQAMSNVQRSLQSGLQESAADPAAALCRALDLYPDELAHGRQLFGKDMRYPLACLRAAMEHSTRLPIATHGDGHLKATTCSVAKRQQAHRKPQQWTQLEEPNHAATPPDQLEYMLLEADNHFQRLQALLFSTRDTTL
ncbi:hypothetical protein WJX74_004576 [Apatococcus lobatus]|uniref:Uncharacterized protein n=1 Tax=Apatococcus lobatus TaxID=904363 RepID=A0AAW1QKW5_9CHLO